MKDVLLGVLHDLVLVEPLRLLLRPVAELDAQGSHHEAVMYFTDHRWLRCGFDALLVQLEAASHAAEHDAHCSQRVLQVLHFFNDTKALCVALQR